VAATQLHQPTYIEVPEDYTIDKLYEYGNGVEYSNINKTYNCGCPICREDSSWGFKKRCYFIPDKDLVFCHNCGWSSKPYNFVREITGFSHKEILSDIKNDDTIPTIDKNCRILRLDESDEDVDVIEVLDDMGLPDGAVDLSDPIQVEYYKNNYQVRLALDYLKERKILQMINAPKKIFFALKGAHRHRLIIPFYDADGEKILHFQSRSIRKFDKIRYLSKSKSLKTLSNIENLDRSKEHYFITEGPIDAYSLRNAMGVAGISESKKLLFTPSQKQQLQSLFHMKRIWVLDNQWGDEASLLKSDILIELGETIFIYPENFKYKDLNKMCVDKGVKGISEEYIIKHSYSGGEASLMLDKIKRRG
jgi:hypothetical protein